MVLSIVASGKAGDVCSAAECPHPTARFSTLLRGLMLCSTKFRKFAIQLIHHLLAELRSVLRHDRLKLFPDARHFLGRKLVNLHAFRLQRLELLLVEFTRDLPLIIFVSAAASVITFCSSGDSLSHVFLLSMNDCAPYVWRVSERYFCTSLNLAKAITDTGFSCPSTTLCSSAVYSSVNARGPDSLRVR